MIPFLRPVDQVSEKETERGLTMLILDGIFAQIMGVLIGGAFIVAYALKIGATNKIIGLLAAISPLAQILQIPTIFLIEKIRYRKFLVVLTVVLGRCLWLLIAMLPWLAPRGLWMPLFISAQLVYYALSAVAGCSWNSWIRDFVPEKLMGGYFAKRAAWLTAFGAVISIAAGIAAARFEKPASMPEAAPQVQVEIAQTAPPQAMQADKSTEVVRREVLVYCLIIGVGTVFGLIGSLFLAAVPEPRMAPAQSASILTILAEPFRDRNFRMLLVFLGWWSFAMNLAAPFFVVYMLKQLHLGMGWVIGLSVVSQAFNVLFFKVWGRLADRFSNKSCLMVSGTLFVFSLALWPFMTMPDPHFLTLPLLIVFHALAGMSTAGVGLCAGNIALKAAPYGRATAYLAVNALVGGSAAIVAPLISGTAADWLESQQLKLTFTWVASGRQFLLPALDIRGLDFVFAASFLLGLFALHRLLAVKEVGEVEEAVVREQLMLEIRKVVRHVSNVAGIRQITHFPYMVLRYVFRSSG